MKKPPGKAPAVISGRSSVAQRRATSNPPRTHAVPQELKFDKRRMADMTAEKRSG